jgi:hypothetical protein
MNKEAEAEHLSQVREVAFNTMLSLRDTLSPKFDAKGLGYRDADHARLEITKQMVKQIDKLAVEHLRKFGG